MPLIKSHSTSFIIKFVILFPLSLAMVFIAMLGTGGGHGNFLPVATIMAPAFLLSPLLQHLHHDIATMCIMLVTACLFPAYALLLHYVKAKIIPFILPIIHIAGAVVILLRPRYNSPLVTEPFSLMLLAIVILILISIRIRSRRIWLEHPAKTTTDSHRLTST